MAKEKFDSTLGMHAYKDAFEKCYPQPNIIVISEWKEIIGFLAC